MPDVTPPVVTSVVVSNDSWSSALLDYLEAASLGIGGYAIPVGSGEQLSALPWSGLNRVAVSFSEHVEIVESSLRLFGVATDEYLLMPGGFSYDSNTFTATWTFSEAFDADKLLLFLAGVTDEAGNALDGDWDNPTDLNDPASSAFPSGDGSAGGEFAFRFNVLAGDVNGNGAVTTADVGLTRSKVGESTLGAEFTVNSDVNGNGAITTADVGFVRSRVGMTLPAGEPDAPVEQTDADAAFGEQTLEPVDAIVSDQDTALPVAALPEPALDIAAAIEHETPIPPDTLLPPRPRMLQPDFAAIASPVPGISSNRELAFAVGLERFVTEPERAGLRGLSLGVHLPRSKPFEGQLRAAEPLVVNLDRVVDNRPDGDLGEITVTRDLAALSVRLVTMPRPTEPVKQRAIDSVIESLDVAELLWPGLDEDRKTTTSRTAARSNIRAAVTAAGHSRL